MFLLPFHTTKLLLDADIHVPPGRETFLVVFGEQKVHGPYIHGIFISH